MLMMLVLNLSMLWRLHRIEKKVCDAQEYLDELYEENG